MDDLDYSKERLFNSLTFLVRLVSFLIICFIVFGFIFAFALAFSV